jgi:hypothetical protein
LAFVFGAAAVGCVTFPFVRRAVAFVGCVPLVRRAVAFVGCVPLVLGAVALVGCGLTFPFGGRAFVLTVVGVAWPLVALEVVALEAVTLEAFGGFFL